MSRFKKRTIRQNWQSVKNRVSIEFKIIRGRGGIDNIKMPMCGINNKIYINPKNIRNMSLVGDNFTKSNYLFSNGDWDVDTRSIEDLKENDIRFITCRELLSEYEISETTEYIFYKNMAKKGVLLRHFGKEEDIRDYLIQLKEMYCDIQNKKVLDESKMADPISGCINVCIDRHGQILLQRHGRHRVAASIYTNIDKIPIVVRAIHRRLADRMLQSGAPKELLDNANKLIRQIEDDNA